MPRFRAVAILASFALTAGALAQDKAPAQPAKPAPPASPAAPAQPAIPDDQKEMMEAYQAASKPGPEHARLAPLVGEWDVVTRAWLSPGAEPIEMKATVKKSWMFNDRFLKEEISGADPMGQPYTGVGYVGFDPGAKQYQGVWISSSSAAMIVYSGKSTADGKFEFTGKESDPTGGAALDFRMTLTIDAPDKHTLTFFYIIPGAGEMKAFEMVHTKKK